MIRVVLAVALAAALVGSSLPAAERAERDRNAALASDELRSIAGVAESLAASNDPTDDGARTTLELRAPAPTLTDGGRIVIADDRLAWQPATGPNRTVDAGVPIRATTIVVDDRARLRLSLVGVDERRFVRIEPRSVNASNRDAKGEPGHVESRSEPRSTVIPATTALIPATTESMTPQSAAGSL